jgi:hypothetical protein
MAVGAQERVLEHVLGELGAAAELAARVAQQLGTVRIHEPTKRVALAGGGGRRLPRAGPAPVRGGSALRGLCWWLLAFVCSTHGP